MNLQTCIDNYTFGYAKLFEQARGFCIIWNIAYITYTFLLDEGDVDRLFPRYVAICQMRVDKTVISDCPQTRILADLIAYEH